MTCSKEKKTILMLHDERSPHGDDVHPMSPKEGSAATVLLLLVIVLFTLHLILYDQDQDQRRPTDVECSSYVSSKCPGGHFSLGTKPNSS